MIKSYSFPTPQDPVPDEIKERAVSVRAMTPIIRPPLIDGFIRRGDYGCIYGDPGSGKSAMAMSIAAAVTAGVPWSGRWTHKGAVLLIGSEGADYHPARLSAAETALQIDPTRSDPVIFYDHPIDLRQMSHCKAVVQATRTRAEADGCDHVALVVIDTLSACAGDADQNTATDMEQVNTGIRVIQEGLGNPSIILVHHSIGATKEGKIKKERGSNAIRGAVDWMIQVYKNVPQCGTTSVVKQPRNGGLLPVFTMKLEGVDVPVINGSTGHNETDNVVAAIPVSDVPSVVSKTIQNTGSSTIGDQIMENLDLTHIAAHPLAALGKTTLNAYQTLLEFGEEGLTQNKWQQKCSVSAEKIANIRDELCAEGLLSIEKHGNRKLLRAIPFEMFGPLRGSEQSGADKT